MELKDFGLTPNTNYNNGSYLVKRIDESDYRYISRTTNKIIFYWDDKGIERRLFLKKAESVKYCEGSEKECEIEEDTPGGQFDEEALREEANKESFLFFFENNPFFNNDFTWAEEPDFVKDNDLMFT